MTVSKSKQYAVSVMSGLLYGFWNWRQDSQVGESDVTPQPIV